MRVGRLQRNDGTTVYARLLDARTDGETVERRAQPLSAAPWLGGVDVGDSFAYEDDAMRAPVTPSKIVCIGRNYAAHAKELGNDVPKEPLLFLKPPSSLIGPGDTIVRPAVSQRVEHEAELGIVIGKRAKDVREDDAMAYVFGFVPVCDVTARDIQKSDVQFTRGKGFDTFCPVGPWIETSLRWEDCGVSARVNGTPRQSGRTRDMIFSLPKLVAYVSAAMTLEPGDLIATGTPEGVGPLLAGDLLEVEIEGVGILKNAIADAR